MADRISVAAANAACDSVVDLLDADASAAYIEIRTGAQPATVATAASGTLLATLTCSATAFGAATGGVATAAAITSDTDAAATGTAGWFRAYDGAGLAVIDGDVGTSGSSMNLNTTSITIGGTVAITSWTVTMPTGA